MIGAWCTGATEGYPLRAGASDASCATDANADAKVVVVCAKK
jgi:hypothetical protein